MFIGSQADPDFLDSLIDKLPPLDIVLDDGSHRAPHQIRSFETIYPRIKPTGLYMVEDLHTSYWPRFNRHSIHRGRWLSRGFVDYCKTQVDALNSFHHQASSWDRFGVPRDERKEPAPADPIARITKAISFYDSMVILERGEIPEPLRIRKEAD